MVFWEAIAGALQKLFSKFPSLLVNNCATVFFVKNRIRSKCFPVDLEKCFRPVFLQNTYEWLYLCLEERLNKAAARRVLQENAILGNSINFHGCIFS